MSKPLVKRVLSIRKDCAYCGEQCSYDVYGPLYATIDHISPKSRGGLDVRSNKTLACLSCNRQKGRALHWHAPAYTLDDVLPPLKGDEDEWPDYWEDE